LRQRRLLAAAQERLAQALFDEITPATDIATRLEEEALRVQAVLRNTTAGWLQWASALLPQVLADAEARPYGQNTRNCLYSIVYAPASEAPQWRIVYG